MAIYEIIQTITSNGTLTLAVVVALLSLVEVSKIKLSPWTALAKWIKKMLFGDISAKLCELDKKFDSIASRLEEDEAKNARSRILRFGDELMTNQKHSKDMFDAVMVDIDSYEAYCKGNPNFLNNMTALTVKRVKSVYMDCLKKRDFL